MTKILFVDDEPNVLAGLRRMLRSFRKTWDMDFAEGGAMALEKLAESPRDVIVTDMRMPGMNGAEFLEFVRDRWPGTVRIVLSGQSDKEATLRSVGPAHQYLSKPCDPESLQSAIKRLVALQQTVASDSVRSLCASVERLPTLPDVYLQLVEELSSPAASIDRAAKIIARDVGLTAKLLQLVNSSFFGLPVHVKDVPHAASLLGLEILGSIVLSTSIYGQYESRKLGGLSLGKLADHSMEVGLLSRKIAAATLSPDESIDDAFLAGSLHDVGRLVLAQVRPGDYSRLCDEVAAGANLLELERLAFGAGHPEIGGYLLGLWGLPTPIVEAVTTHHEPSRCSDAAIGTATAVHTAEALLDPGAELDTVHLNREGHGDAIDDWRSLASNPAELASA